MNQHQDLMMKKVSISICALPNVLWKQNFASEQTDITIYPFVKAALAIEQQMQQRIQQIQEYAHYRYCCEHMEVIASPRFLTPFATVEQFRATLEIDGFPMSTLSKGYLDALALLLENAPRELRLGATFFPPEMMAEHIVGFQWLARKCGILDHPDIQKRSRFFTLACEFECGVIEMQTIYS